MKNTVYVYSKTSPNVLDPPAFALDLALHFVNKYEHISKAFIDVISHKWSRIQVGGKDHKWSFVRDGDEKGTVECCVDGSSGKENLTATLKCGLKDLLGMCISPTWLMEVLKTSGSSFEKFYRDELTTLPGE